MRHPLALLALALTTTSLLGQEKKKEPKDEPLQPIAVVKLDRKTPIDYEKDVLPILENKCSFCHAGAVKEAKFDMGTYETLLKGGKRGQPIIPGKPDQSLLIQLAGKTQNPAMPPKTEDPLTPEELALLKLWIEQGAKGPATVIAKKREIKLNRLPEQVKPVMAVAISPDKSTVAAGRGGQIHIYDAGSGFYIRALVNPELKDDSGMALHVAHLDLVHVLTFSPDGRFLASGGFQEVILWDTQTGLPYRKLAGFADRVVALGFSRDGKLLATGGGAPTEDGELKVFDVMTGDLVVDIKNGHSDTVFGVCFSPDGTKLAACAADKFVKVFEVPSGQFVKAFEGHTHHVLDVGWKADGKILASCGADNVIKVWDYEKGEQTRTIQGHKLQITRMLFIGTTSQVVTACGDATVRFWNLDNGGNVRNFGGNNDFLYAVGVSPDGAVVAAGGQESVVRVYNGSNGQLIRTLTPP
jgi:hypothetical protein